MGDVQESLRAAARTWGDLDTDRALALDAARRLRDGASSEESRGQADVLTMQVVLSYRVDDLLMLLQRVAEQMEVPWYRRAGFLAGVLAGVGVAVALATAALAFWLVLAG